MGTGGPGRAGASGPMDVNLLQQIVELMSANDLNTVDLRDGEKRVGEHVSSRSHEAGQSRKRPKTRKVGAGPLTIFSLSRLDRLEV